MFLILGALAPNVYMLNKTSSAVSLHFDEPVCAGGNNGYIYEYQVYYSKSEPKISTIWNFIHNIKCVYWKGAAEDPF